MENKKNMRQLFVPIFLELIFLTLVGSIDTLMLSSVGDNAVGGVGTANTYMGIFTISFSVISSGITAVMTQYIGAKKPGVALQANRIGCIFNGTIGAVISLILLFFSSPVLKLLGVSNALFSYTKTYMTIVGGTCILNALIPVFSSYLRAFGHTRGPLVATVASNVVNICLNAFFLYAIKLGVTGVAIATVTARLVNLAIVLMLVIIKIKIPRDAEKINNKTVIAQIFKIGFPAALETALYNLAMTLVMKFLNQMDTEGFNVTARTYSMQITNFSYIAAVAMAHANAIITGWCIGEKDYERCYKNTLRTAKTGIIVSVTLAGIFAVLCRPLMSLFTTDQTMISIIQYIFIIDIVLEIGRASNLIFGTALKTCGDATYTVIIAVIFMYLFAVLGTYLLGIKLDMFVIGSFIALALDECARAVLMFIRWRSRKWKKKVLVK